MQKDGAETKTMNPQISQRIADSRDRQTYTINGVEEAQPLNYLNATGLKRELLLNFGSPRLELKRLVFTHLRTSAHLRIRI
jgi:PD-(D/E)XK nuclease superfamily